jgi:ABC-2 type transport system permease protein
MSMIAGVFCSGMLLPLNVFPGALGEVVRALPWSSLVQGPADVLLGTADPLATYAFQASWAMGLLALGRLIQSVATRRVVVQGG